MSPPMPPTPPSPPIISRQSRDEDEQRTSSRSHHRTARDYRASRSRSRGRGRASRSRSRGRGRVSRTPERKYKQRVHSRSRSREPSRYHSARKHKQERSRSRSRLHNDRRRRNSHRSRSPSFSRSHRGSHRSRSRSKSPSRRRHNRSESRSKKSRGSRSRSSRREERSSSSKQANVIVLSTESYKDSLKSSGKLPPVQEDNGTPAPQTTQKPTTSDSTPSWKITKADQVGVYSNLEPDEPIDKEKIHKEIEEKLRLALAKEGKVYPYPKPEPSHPVFANDGSFLEIFKKMQQQQTFVQQQVGESMQIHAVPAAPVAPVMPPVTIQQPPPPQLPIFGRRRGGKILKTGVVAKPKVQSDTDTGDVKDFWSIYLREVKKYKSTACESDSKTRPLVR